MEGTHDVTARRFYKAVAVTDDLGIALDGRRMKTPAKVPLILPTRAAAEAIAAEWDAQGEKIDAASMTLTKLANTAIDRVAANRDAIIRDIVDFANSDLVCYRADQPDELVRRQSAAWDPVVDWALTALDAPFAVTTGVIHKAQSPEALHAHESAVRALNDFELAAYHTIMTLTGSALLAIMLVRNAIVPEAAWIAAHVDEDFQIEQWGRDDEAQARRAARYAEFIACCRFLGLSRA
jgi:chaperone required for assembly of F1-ATPase